MHFVLIIADNIIERIPAHHGVIWQHLKELLLLLPPPLLLPLLLREPTLELLGRQPGVCIEAIHCDSIWQDCYDPGVCTMVDGDGEVGRSEFLLLEA